MTFENAIIDTDVLFGDARGGPCQHGLLCGCKALRTWTDRPPHDAFLRPIYSCAGRGRRIHRSTTDNFCWDEIRPRDWLNVTRPFSLRRKK